MHGDNWRAHKPGFLQNLRPKWVGAAAHSAIHLVQAAAEITAAIGAGATFRFHGDAGPAGSLEVRLAPWKSAT